MNKFAKVFMLVLCLCLLVCGAAMAQECQHGSKVVDYHAQIAPTCTQPAYVRYTCEDGCVVYGWATEADGSGYQALGHAQEWKYIGEPDCTTTGLAESVCSRCGQALDADGKEATEAATKVVKELGHIFNNGTLTTAPTCCSTGVVTYTCDRCGLNLVVTQAMLDDIAAGKTAVPQMALNVKGIEWDDVAAKIAINPDGHKFGAPQQFHAADGATCHSIGLWHKICELCGVQVDASYINKGEKDVNGKVAEKDGTPYEPMTAHNYVTETVKYTSPVPCEYCSETYTYTYCKDCVEIVWCEHEDGYKHIDTAYDTILETHVYNLAQKSEVSKDGYTYTNIYYDANRDVNNYCLKIVEVDTPLVPHTFAEDELTIITEPTCTEDGEATGVCLVCGQEDLPVVLKALGHDWDDGKVTTYPTCTTKGVKTFTCKRCEVTKTEDIAMIPHTPVTTWYDDCECGATKVAHADATKTYGATCLLAADYHTVCAICGNELTTAGVATEDGKAEVKHVDAKGHAWGEWSPVNGASATSLGYKDRVCTRENTEVVTTATLKDGVVTVETKKGNTWKCNILDNFVWVSKPTCKTPGVAFHYYYNQADKTFINVNGSNNDQVAAYVAVTTNKFVNPEKEELAVIDHTWDAGVITTPATKDNKGVITYTCTVCGATKTEEFDYVSKDPVYELQGVTFADGALEGEVVLTAGDAVDSLYVRVTFFFADGSTVITETFVEDGEFDAYANGDVTAIAYVLTDAAGSPVKVPGDFTDLAHGGISVK